MFLRVIILLYPKFKRDLWRTSKKRYENVHQATVKLRRQYTATFHQKCMGFAWDIQRMQVKRRTIFMTDSFVYLQKSHNLGLKGRLKVGWGVLWPILRSRNSGKTMCFIPLKTCWSSKVSRIPKKPSLPSPLTTCSKLYRNFLHATGWCLTFMPLKGIPIRKLPN